MKALTMKPQKRIIKILDLLKEATKGMPPPMSAQLALEYGRDPFVILISCLLSLRARDVMTYPISKQLFALARTPEELIDLDRSELEKVLHPLGFYRRKAAIIQSVSQELIDRFDSKVPSKMEELLSIKGIGRKTANLVLSIAFGIPGMTVDTHVHQVANRLGLVSTNTPDETERELRKVVPQELWMAVTHYFVLWGQSICVPRSPFCSKCVLSPLCPKIDVTKRR